MLQAIDKLSLRDLQGRAKNESPVTFDLVRHGSTVFNGDDGVSVDRERGWSNVPLTPEGEQESVEAGIKLKGRGITAIECSDLNRAQQTADIIGEILGIKPKCSVKLRPWDLGTLSGKEMTKVTPVIGAYARSRPDTPVEGGGESFNQFRLRMFDGVASAIRRNPGRVVLVAHHRVERGLAGWRAKGYPIEHAIDIDTFLKDGDPPGGIIEFKTARQLIDGELAEKLTHLEAEYGPGYGDEYCRTCRFSDHQAKPNCSWVMKIEKRGYCRFWKS